MTKWEKVEKERESDTSIICVTNVAHERWGEVDCVEINVLPQLGVRFNLQYHILKSEPLDEGQLPEEDFFLLCLSVFFILPSWAGGWCNRNQTQARMWGIHSGETSLLNRVEKRDEKKFQFNRFSHFSYFFVILEVISKTEKARTLGWKWYSMDQTVEGISREGKGDLQDGGNMCNFSRWVVSSRLFSLV